MRFTFDACSADSLLVEVKFTIESALFPAKRVGLVLTVEVAERVVGDPHVVLHMLASAVRADAHAARGRS